MLRFDLASRLPVSLSETDLVSTARALTQALRLKRPSCVHITFVTERAIQGINTRERGFAKPTDVLSFGSPDAIRRLTPRDVEVDLGEVVICPAFATKEARRRSIDIREEFIRLIVHGVLHIEGYDHARPKEEAQMFALQERLVAEIAASSRHPERSPT